jgi:pilus assembly protein CpaB
MRRSLVSLVVGVVFAIIAVVLMYSYIQSNLQGAPQVQAAPQIELGTIVVAAKDMPFGAIIDRQSLKPVQWPKASIPTGTFTSVDEIYAGAEKPGDRIALALVAHDEPLTKAKVSGFGAKPTLSRQVEMGKRAISIAVNDVVGVSGFVLPGDRVDIMLTRKPVNGSGLLTTEMLLQNVVILGIDQLADQAADKPQVARTATVEVTPEEAQKLILAQQAGALSLALRSVEQADTVDIKPVTEAELNRRPPPPPPPKEPPAARPIPVPPGLPTVRVRYGTANAIETPVRP